MCILLSSCKLYYLVEVRERVSKSHRRTYKITDLNIILFIDLESKPNDWVSKLMTHCISET